MLQWISAVLRSPFDDDKHAEGKQVSQSLQHRLQTQHRHDHPLRQKRGMVKAAAQRVRRAGHSSDVLNSESRIPRMELRLVPLE